MRKSIWMCAATAAALHTGVALADAELDALKQQLDLLRSEYQQRIQALEQRLEQAERKAGQAEATAQQVAVEQASQSSRTAPRPNSFNPAISLILDGRYASFDNDPEAYELPGFALGGEAELGEPGLSLGHTELVASANVDDRFFGQTTLAIAEHDGETEVELEEAFIQTLGLGHGLTLKAGRFFSGIGYLNGKHQHAWDFADAPLVYRGLFGNQLRDDGLQLTYLAPTDHYLLLGAEALSGSSFPSGGSHDGVGAWSAFAKLGGDIGVEHSWQLGLNHWQADDIDGRTSGGHSHGGGDVETPSFSGDSTINAVDLVYKWAPGGNYSARNFKFQWEYFDRREDGTVTLLNSGPPLEVTSYDGKQSGWYAQAVYQFMPQWAAGLRYDRLRSDNTGSDADVLGEAGLDDEGHTPQRFSVMAQWLPSEFSRIRLQFNRDESGEERDQQIFLQFTHSLGSHGAHAY